MAQISSFIVKALIVAVIAAVAVSGQELAPAPAPDVGGGFSVPVSTAVVGTSVLISLIALIRN